MGEIGDENDYNKSNKYLKLGDDDFNSLDIANIPLPRKKFVLVFTSLVICLAMSSLDSSIVSTALPRISSDFKSDNEYTWVLTAYFLGDMAFEPMFGKFADIFGRKQVLLFVLTLFIVSSALCGAAQSIQSLIVFRGFQGIGGGGFFSMVIVIIADIVPLRKRGVYMGITSAVSTCASVLGPLVGGLLTDYLSWRWAFFINFPLCLAAGIIIYFQLNMPSKHVSSSFFEKLKKIDFIGTFLLVGSIVSILLALTWGGVDYEWGSTEILSLLISFAVSFTSFLYVEYKIANDPIIPLQMFKSRNVVVTCFINFFFGMSAMTVNNTLPLLFHDGRGISATFSGLMLAPQSITSSFGNILTGYLIGKYGYIQRYMMAGTCVVILGNFLLSSIGMDTSIFYILFVVILLGLKLGLNTHSCVLITQQSVQKKFMSVGSTVMTFFHLIGGILGISLYGITVSKKFKNNYLSAYPEAENGSLELNIKNIDLLPNGTKYYVTAIQDTYRLIPFTASIITLISIFFLKNIPVIGSRIHTVPNKLEQKIKDIEEPKYEANISKTNIIIDTSYSNKSSEEININDTIRRNRRNRQSVRFSVMSNTPATIRSNNRKSYRISYMFTEFNVIDNENLGESDEKVEDIINENEEEDIEISLF